MQHKNIEFPLLKEEELQKFLREESEALTTTMLSNYAAGRLRSKIAAFIAQISNQERYNVSVPYIAMIYFDRFISTEVLPTLGKKDAYYRANVLAISCLSLALKMRGKPIKVETILQSVRGLDIQKNHVYKVEKRVRKATGSPANFVHALCFVPNFLSIVAEPGLSIKAEVIRMIIQSQADSNVARFKPSVIAASAVLAIRSISLSSEKFAEYFLKFTGEDVILEQRDIDSCAEAMVRFRHKNPYAIDLEKRTSSSISRAAKVSSSSDMVHRPGKLTIEDELEIENVPTQRPGKETVKDESESERVPTLSPGKEIIMDEPEMKDVLTQGAAKKIIKDVSEMEGFLRKRPGKEIIMDEAEMGGFPRQRPGKGILRDEPEMGVFPRQRPGKEIMQYDPEMEDVPRQRPGKEIMKDKAEMEDVPTERHGMETTDDEFEIEENDLMNIELIWMADDNQNQRLDEYLFPPEEPRTTAFMKKLNCCKKID